MKCKILKSFAGFVFFFVDQYAHAYALPEHIMLKFVNVHYEQVKVKVVSKSNVVHCLVGRCIRCTKIKLTNKKAKNYNFELSVLNRQYSNK